jgi:hypothetical protein
MKKLLNFFCILGLGIPSVTFAEKLIINKNSQSIQEFSMGLLYNTALPLLSILALGSLIWGGVNIMMAGGDDSKVAKGRTIITYSVAGILLILLSYAIINWLAQAIYVNIK